MMKDQDGPTDQNIGRPYRMITLTFTGKQLYEQTATKFSDRQKKLQRKLGKEQEEMATDFKQSYILQRDRTIILISEFHEFLEEFMSYLERSNSDESDREKLLKP